LATSDTSARVGIGFWIIDSIIWVATITALLWRRACRMIFFWMPISSASPISTPRSPRATITASEALIRPSRVSSSATASARSIFATSQAVPPASSRS
jgi:hypothetical protein